VRQDRRSGFSLPFPCQAPRQGNDFPCCFPAGRPGLNRQRIDDEEYFDENGGPDANFSRIFPVRQGKSVREFPINR
jgi:hypothetical protein